MVKLGGSFCAGKIGAVLNEVLLDALRSTCLESLVQAMKEIEPATSGQNTGYSSKERCDVLSIGNYMFSRELQMSVMPCPSSW
jgi:hypothetical protein